MGVAATFPELSEWTLPYSSDDNFKMHMHNLVIPLRRLMEAHEEAYSPEINCIQVSER